MTTAPAPAPVSPPAPHGRAERLAAQFGLARRRGTPIIAIETPDPASTIDLVVDRTMRRRPAGQDQGGAVAWDVVRGLTEVLNGKDAIAAMSPSDSYGTAGNPTAAATLAQRLPPRHVLFVHMAHRWLDDAPFIQAVWLLRDAFKQDMRTLVLLGPAFCLPPEISGDVLLLDEGLPGPDELRAIVATQHEAAGLEVPGGPVLERAVDAVQGLPAFQAEQVTAMSLTPAGLDVDALWERKRKQIEQTPGLKVYRGVESFAEVGGVPVVKAYLRQILDGRERPNAIVFLDEIEKMLAGSGHDTSGVAQDQLGTLLSYMQDQGAVGVLFVGPPGSAKSMVAKAAGSHAGIPTIRLDLGAAKGSLVGQSEQQLRSALKVITSVSSGRSLWIATCNSIGELPPELRRRFTLGTFFFDLPSAEERAQIWRLHLGRHGLEAEDVRDEGWTGAEIRQCCEIAWRLGCGVAAAAAFVVPVARSAADQIERLRQSARGRFLSASCPGVYDGNEPARSAPAGGRAMNLNRSHDD